MRTLPTTLRRTMTALIVLACVPPAALVQAEERDANLRQQILKLNDITGKDPLRHQVLSLLQDKDVAKKRVAEAARMARETPQPFSYNATLILGTVSVQVKDYNAAETFYRLHREQAKQLRSTQGLVSAYRGLIAAALINKRYVQAEKLCAEVRANEILGETLQSLQGESDKEADKERQTLALFLLDVFEDQAMAIAQQGEVKRAISLIDDQFKDKDQANSLLVLDLKGKIYRIAGKNKEALKVYEDEIERIKKDYEDEFERIKNDNDLKKKDQKKQLDLKKKEQKKLLDDVAYALSGVYIELGQVDKAAEQLKNLLATEPDNPKYNNDLGYIWADHDMNLTEAEKLIRKALEEDRKQRQKDNPQLKPEQIKDRGAYLDSLGWVLFKQKKYQEAKKYLQQAVQPDDEDESIEILDHLGDVLMALGEKSEAVAVWKKGVESAGDSKRERKRKEEVQKKLKANE